jgi:anti-sigma factor RsiW
MKHHASKDWIDFARGTLSEGQKAAMQAHLDAGCSTCHAEFTAWSWMSRFGRAESSNEPPAEALRVVKSAVVGRSPQKARSRMREIAELVLDSYSQPQIVGVRSTTLAPRQLLYRAGSVLIDMRLQTAGDTDRFTLSGQVLRSGENKQALRQVPVHLLSGTHELASTATNQFGEFSLEHEVGRDLQVSLEVSEERDVFIPLDETIWRATFATS